MLIDHQGVADTGPAVGATNRQGAYEATRYLFELGHRRIGFITGQLKMGCAVTGWPATRRPWPIPAWRPTSELIRTGDFFQPHGYACAQALLGLAQPPTAIFASNDVLAFGVMEAVRELACASPRMCRWSASMTFRRPRRSTRR